MLTKIFTVFDSKAEAFLPPFYRHAKGLAIRDFSELVNDSNHLFGKHPEDYVLFELGNYDDSTASIDTLAAPMSLGVGIEFIKI